MVDALHTELRSQQLAQRLLPESVTIAASVTEQLAVALPELFPPTYPEALQQVRESTEQNVGAVLAMLAFGVTPPAVEPPAGTRASPRRWESTRRRWPIG